MQCCKDVVSKPNTAVFDTMILHRHLPRAASMLHQNGFDHLQIYQVSDNFERRNQVSPHAWRLLIIHLSLISPSSSGSATSASCFLKSAFMRLFKVPPPPPSARPLLSLLELELLEPPPRLEAEVAPLLLPDA